MTTFCVITHIPADNDEGNLAHELDLWREDRNGNITKLSIERAMKANLRTRVFELGEILVLNEGGREAGGVGRKPDKWLVDYEEFEDVEDALVCSQQVLAASFAS